MKNIKAREEYSKNKLDEVRQKISIQCNEDKDLKRYSNNFTIIVGGSYARLEASEESDMDYFIVCQDVKCQEVLKSKSKCIQECIQKTGIKNAAPDGAFGEIETIKEMTENVGGRNDINAKITRRILFLIEGIALYNKSVFNQYREKLIKKYISDKITDHQLSMFLLNDIIRYYRTVCVDFEYKTAEAGKPWGTRNIKLIYARKLLYFSSILVCAETAQRDYEDKVKITNDLLCKTPIQRIQEVCGARADKALKIYDDYLVKLSDKRIRQELDAVSKENARDCKTYIKMKNNGHHYNWELLKLLHDTYASNHPIHRALIL